MYCINCGANIEDGVNFCPACGSPRSGNTIPNKVEKVRLLAALSRSERVVANVFSVISDVQGIDNQIHQLQAQIADINSPQRKFVRIALPVCICGMLFIITSLFSAILSMVNGIFVLIGLLVKLLIVLIAVITLVRSKRKRAKRISGLEEEIQQLATKKPPLLDKVDAIKETDEYIFARDYLPTDYFYPEAVTMLIFYINNGQADNMKEALKEYDQYLHRCKMEYEARRTAEAAERTAFASERTAAASERAAAAAEQSARSMRAVEQYSASTSFWTTYNAFRSR